MVSKSRKLVLLTTKTLHHDFFISVLSEKKKIDLFVIFEKRKLKPSFKVGDIDLKKQIHFEKKNFFKKKDFIMNCPHFTVSSINNIKCKKILNRINPDLGISFGTGKINPEIIKLFNKGIINIHRGIMTKYRGLDSEFWASYHSDFKSIGTTIHYVNKHLDKGKTIFQKKLKIKSNYRAHMLRYFTTLIAAKNVNNIVEKIFLNRLKLQAKQDHGRYYSFIPLSLKKIAYKKFNSYCKNK